MSGDGLRLEASPTRGAGTRRRRVPRRSEDRACRLAVSFVRSPQRRVQRLPRREARQFRAGRRRHVFRRLGRRGRAQPPLRSARPRRWTRICFSVRRHVALPRQFAGGRFRHRTFPAKGRRDARRATLHLLPLRLFRRRPRRRRRVRARRHLVADERTRQFGWRADRRDVAGRGETRRHQPFALEDLPGAEHPLRRPLRARHGRGLRRRRIGRGDLPDGRRHG